MGKRTRKEVDDLHQNPSQPSQATTSSRVSEEPDLGDTTSKRRRVKGTKTGALKREVTGTTSLDANSQPAQGSTQGDDAGPANDQPKPLKRARSRKSLPKIEPSMYEPRVDSKWKVGAHISAAGGVENAILNAAEIRANAFALFVKSQRKWTSPPISEASAQKFKELMTTFGYDPALVLPHGSYLVNLANPDEAKREKSYEAFLDDLQRCEQLGLLLYNFHPGSTTGQCTMDVSISHLASSINRAHKETKHVIIVIENMAGSGNILGANFQQLADIIKLVENKSRVGVCLDTCHLFAAGYDLRSLEEYQKTMASFEEIVGLKYLKGMHINDSKGALNSKKDRHENIGLGELGLSAFKYIMTDPRMQGIPLILETPNFDHTDLWKKEIDVLNRLSEIQISDPKDGLEASALEEIKAERALAEKSGKGPRGRSTAKDKPKKATKKAKKKLKADDDDESELTELDSDET